MLWTYTGLKARSKMSWRLGEAKGEGSVQVAGHKLEILPQDAKYVLIYATCAINFAAVGIAIAAGVVVAYYLTYALLAWLFALLVYYTVKMM